MEAKLADKRWKKDFEPPIYDSWKLHRRYAFEEDPKKEMFSIDTPPPYVNTPVHIGHATTYTLMDMFARYHRMIGHNVLFPLGMDRNGLPIEMAAEKKFKISALRMPREEFLGYCEKMLRESSAASMNSFLKLGISFNGWEEGSKPGDVYNTDSREYRTMTQGTFIDLYTKGLIYEGTQLTSYCPGCRTTIADSEVEYDDKPTMLDEVNFNVKDSDEKVTIATTRPELLCTSAMVIYHPDDDRYKHLENKSLVVPIYNIEVTVKPHPMANPKFGTGLVFMSRSAGDQNAIRFLREMNIEPEMAIDPKGRMKENAGFLAGMKAKEAREKITEELKNAGALVKQNQIMHRTPICERSKHDIEYIMLPELYLKQVDAKEKMLKLTEELNFFSPSSKQILIDWINSITIDWPISRNRFYATEVPLWYCKACKKALVPPKGKYYQPWKDPAPVDKCECGSTEFEGDQRVLDTWFDSSNSPLFVLKYGSEDFEKRLPCTLRPQGREIIRTWLYYTVLKDYMLTGKLIFRDVWINYYVVDEHGKKMSKSKGNVIDPQIILDKYGAEPFRLWVAVEGNITGSDFRCSFDRIDGANKTLIKLWNVARFVSMFPRPAGKVERTALDDWILGEMNEIVEMAKEKYAQYDMHTPTTRIKNFLWEAFASNYLELVKNRAYNEDGHFTEEQQNGALWTLHEGLRTILKLLAPVTPFITEKVFRELYDEDIHEQSFPDLFDVSKPEFTSVDITSLNSAVWKAKKEGGLALKHEIAKITAPISLRSVGKEIKGAHQAREIAFEDRIEITL